MIHHRTQITVTPMKDAQPLIYISIRPSKPYKTRVLVKDEVLAHYDKNGQRVASEINS